jgi:hypothetical protein
MTSQKLEQHRSNNKLRDVESELVDEGNAFSWNSEILYSFDVCGHCESHAMLLGIGYAGDNNPSSSKIKVDALDTVPLLKDIKDSKILSSPHLAKCPKPAL